MDAVKDIKSRLDVADIVGEYLPLKPAGVGSFKGLCPFHQENTPSFYVNRSRQSFHCFGCDKGGDIIEFVMEFEGMGFREALELLAQKAGIALPAPSPQEARRADERRRLKELNELAAKFYRMQLLQSPDAEYARAYAMERGIDDLTGDLFKIGYAPGKGWDALTKALIGKGATADELINAGLSIKHAERGTVYDRFRDRLMFAIQDIHGNVVGFTGRALNKEEQAKYINTPETAVYHKSAILYGLDKAKADIKRHDLAVIVEGNMDVVTSHRLGVQHVICSSGTALTDEQLRLIERFTKNIAIAFDADKAGMAATLRGLDLARARDFNVKLITLSEAAGKDPDEAATKDIALWKDAIRNAHDVMDWVFQTAFKGRNASQPQDKKEIAQQVFPEIQRIADPIIRDHWLQKLAAGLNTSVSALQEALRRHTQTTPTSKSTTQKTSNAPTNTPRPKKDKRTQLAERALAILITEPSLFAQMPAGVEQALPEPLTSLYNTLKTRYDSAQSNEEALSPNALTAGLEETQTRLVDYLVMLADRELPERTTTALGKELADTCALLTKTKNDDALKRLNADMRAAELAGDTHRINELTAQFQSLVSRGNP